MTVIEAVEQALKNERRLGSSRVEIDPAILKSFFGRVEQRPSKPTQEKEFPVTSALLQTPITIVPASQAPLVLNKVSTEKLNLQEPATKPTATTTSKLSTSSPEPMSGSLNELRNQAISCEKCGISKVDSRDELNGLNQTAKILFITEPSGNKSDEAMNPLIGPSGELFAKMIQAMKVTVEDVYVAQVHRCRLKDSEAIAPHELALLEQIKILQPAVIVTFSPIALRLFSDKQSINDCRGEWINWQGIPVMPTYSPSFLLRSENVYGKSKKKQTWQDLQEVIKIFTK